MNISEIENNPDLRKLNLACGQDIRPVSANWVNADMLEGPNVQKMDVFSLPWPFPDDHFDYILAQHILEHVPHNIPEHGFAKNFLHCLMEEIWRVLKVDGILNVVSPGGLRCLAGAMDHKRFIMPETFHIFYPDGVWSFQTRCRFALEHVHNNETLRFRILKKILLSGFGVDISQLRPHIVRFQLRKLPAATQPDQTA